MNVIVYNIDQKDKESLAVANGKRHKLTIIGYEINKKTIHFARLKDVVIIVSEKSILPSFIFQKLISFEIKYIILWSRESVSYYIIGKSNDVKTIHQKITDSESAISMIIKILDVL